ncbi:head-tail adaptor [Sphingobium faniae]|nr:head-tail adaptor [Sphingobium faniae]
MASGSLRSGRRDRRIIIERATITRNPYNEPFETWGEYCREYAAVFYGNGTEQREAAQTQASQVASFEVLANSKTRAISVTDRISFGGGLWDIRSVAPIGRDGVKINAVRAAA